MGSYLALLYVTHSHFGKRWADFNEDKLQKSNHCWKLENQNLKYLEIT